MCQCCWAFIRTINKGRVLQLLPLLLAHDSGGSVQRLENVLALAPFQRWGTRVRMCGGFAYGYVYAVGSADFHCFHCIFWDSKLTLGQFCRRLMGCDASPAIPRLRQR